MATTDLECLSTADVTVQRVYENLLLATQQAALVGQLRRQQVALQDALNGNQAAPPPHTPGGRVPPAGGNEQAATRTSSGSTAVIGDQKQQPLAAAPAPTTATTTATAESPQRSRTPGDTIHQ